MRALVVETDGTIARVINAPPEMFSIQATEGQSVFALLDDDGSAIADDEVRISEAGTFEGKLGKINPRVPAFDLGYVAPE